MSCIVSRVDSKGCVGIVAGITDEDHIISKAEAKIKYYHKECAEFVHLI